MDWRAGWPRWSFAGPRRRLLIHAGLHKTGTTSLQAFLAGHAGDLRSHGILYPTAGRFPAGGDGHHNIAWQLTGDRRFAPELGTIDDVAEEISEHAGDAIISSEDFESGLAAPRIFAPLSSHEKLPGHDIVVLVYVRRQSAYLESLYLELLDHGLAEPLAVFAEPLFTDRRLRFRDWVFEFDYAALQRAWRRSRSLRLVLRRYPSGQGESVVADFAGFACPALAGPARGWTARANRRAPVRTGLQQFFVAMTGRPPTAGEDAAIAALAKRADDLGMGFTPELHARLDACFKRSNRKLYARTGIWLDRARQENHAACLALDLVFSATTCHSISSG